MRNEQDVEPSIRKVIGKLKYTDQLIKLVGVKESGIRAALEVAEDAQYKLWDLHQKNNYKSKDSFG